VASSGTLGGRAAARHRSVTGPRQRDEPQLVAHRAQAAERQRQPKSLARAWVLSSP
jgi:hypothetical protein